MTDQEYKEYVDFMQVMKLEPYTKEWLEENNKSWIEKIYEEEDKKFLEAPKKSS
jgi:hypothetical protein